MGLVDTEATIKYAAKAFESWKETTAKVLNL